MVRKMGAAFLSALLFSSCGTAVQQVRTTVPLQVEQQQQAEREQKLIESRVVKPDWASTPRVVYAKPVWIPPDIRRIYIPPHVAPDGSMVAGYYVWKIVVPGRWRKPGEKVGEIPVSVRYVPKEAKKQRISPQDAEAIINFLKKYKEK
jgi:hypothetical protein